MKTTPDFTRETELYDTGLRTVAGVDEVGRGPLAGPVYAAAVVLNPADIPDGLNDSKGVTAKNRQILHDALLERAEVAIGWASVEEIDEINILHASMLAMTRAVQGLSCPVDHVLVDGNRVPKGLSMPATAVVKGDSKSLSIAAASIVAKIRRDLVMCDLAQHYPAYGWEKNMGYPTKQHRDALIDFGVTPHHRRSFKPVHNILYQEKI